MVVMVVFKSFFAVESRSEQKQPSRLVLAYAMHFVCLYRIQCKMDEEVKTKRKNEKLKENGAQTETKRLCSTI